MANEGEHSLVCAEQGEGFLIICIRCAAYTSHLPRKLLGQCSGSTTVTGAKLLRRLAKGRHPLGQNQLGAIVKVHADLEVGNGHYTVS